MQLESREKWLNHASGPLAKLIADAGFAMPEKVRYTCGWPSRGGLGKAKRTIGQCWDSKCSADKTFEILISPTQAEPVEVLAILIHEMIHAAVGLECGHKGNFRKCAKAVGLEGKMTATNAGKELTEKLMKIGEKLGNYPHAKLTGRSKDSGPKKQGCRQLKCTCEDCGYLIRVTRQWIDQGLPVCCCGGAFTDESDGSDE